MRLSVTEQKAKVIMALARLEARAAEVAAQAMQSRVALAVGDVVPRYADQLRMGRDCERVAELWRDVAAALEDRCVDCTHEAEATMCAHAEWTDGRMCANFNRKAEQCDD